MCGFKEYFNFIAYAINKKYAMHAEKVLCSGFQHKIKEARFNLHIARATHNDFTNHNNLRMSSYECPYKGAPIAKA